MMLLYAKIFLEIKRRGKLNIGRYSSQNAKLSNTKNEHQSTTQKPINESNRQLSIKSKSFRLKERLSEKLSLKDDRSRKENSSVKEVSFNTKDNRCRATWSGTSNAQKRKIVLVECSNLSKSKHIIPKVDLCIECDQKNDQISNLLIKSKEEEPVVEENEKQIELNNNDCIEKIKLEEDLDVKNNQNDHEKENSTKTDLTKDDEKDKENETVIAKQKYQQITILTADSNIESQLKELKSLDNNVKVEVQIISTSDDDEDDQIIDNNKINNDKVDDENFNLNKSSIKEKTIDRPNQLEERRVSIKKWFLLPKVTVYFRKNLRNLDNKRKKKQKLDRKTGNFEQQQQSDTIKEDQSNFSMDKFDKESAIQNDEIKSIDTVVDRFNQKTRKRKALRSLLWLRKMALTTDQRNTSYPDNLQTNGASFEATRKRIENEETGSLSFEFSSSLPRFSLEDLPTSTTYQSTLTTPINAKQTTLIQNRLLPLSCSSSSLKINRSNLPVRSSNQQTSIIGEKTLSKSSLINRTLHKNVLTKSTINLTNTLNLTDPNESSTTHHLSTNRNRLVHHQLNQHSLSLHIPSSKVPSISSTSVNQNSILTNSSDYMNTQSNQSSFYLSRIESSRLRQEKKAALQLGLIMGGFLVRFFVLLMAILLCFLIKFLNFK